MKLIFSLFIVLSSTYCFAYEQVDFENVMQTYLRGVATKDSKLLEGITSKEYLILLMRKIKDQKKSSEKRKYEFDLTFKQSTYKENLYFVNIKNKSDENYSSNWYVIEEENNKLKITDLRFIDH